MNVAIVVKGLAFCVGLGMGTLIVNGIVAVTGGIIGFYSGALMLLIAFVILCIVIYLLGTLKSG